MSKRIHIFLRALTAATLACLTMAPAGAAETPVSFGAPATVDIPVLRIPLIKKPPTIDGVMREGEWEDASALSGFWYDWGHGGGFRFLAPMQTQLQLYAAYDKEHLYFAYRTPVYPENSWLKARGRFPDVINHPLYGVQWDDHLELELRPYHDHVRGFNMGLFKLYSNPIGVLTDFFWTAEGGWGRKWQSQSKVRTTVTGTHWITEWAVPLKEMVHGKYRGNGDDAKPLVKLPPPDGTTYRAWFTRAIGGNGPFFNAFDSHIWNTTKTKLIFDPAAPSFQINELGPIMEDMIDVTLSVKNHNTRSATVRIGFFVESAEGAIYSSYEAPEMKDGMLELVPGENRKLRLRQPFPGISQDGNVLWFDVRSAGRPAKVLFRTRLMRFHSMEGGNLRNVMTGEIESFRKRRLDIIAELRPPRMDFEFITHFSSYTKRIDGVVDIGIHGASAEAKTAVEAKLIVMRADEDEQVVAEEVAPVNGNFAPFLLDLPKLIEGESYRASLLLFDANKRIVGERNPEPFTYQVPVWQGNKIGMDDVVWEPFTPIKPTADGFETLKHKFAIAPSGLPASIYVKPDPRELPLERRGAKAEITDEELQAFGRGPQLRAPMRLEAVVDGARVSAEVVQPAKLVRQWKSEFEYASKLKVGPLEVDLRVRYDCDGSIHVGLDYAAAKPARLERFELVTDAAGIVNMALSAIHGGGMQGGDKYQLNLPQREGVVWDGTDIDMAELYYSRFVPWFWFGSGDHGFSWYCDSDRGWVLDREGATMTLEQNKTGEITWRVMFVNHAAMVEGKRSTAFAILTHPAKPKPKDFRKLAWHYQGTVGLGYMVEPIILSEEYLKKRWHYASGAPKDLPWEQAATWRKEEPPWVRYGQWRNIGVTPELDQMWEDKATYYFEQHIRIGRRTGWWMDEYWPVGFGRSNNLAMGNAYLRDPKTVGKDELPWQSGFLTTYMRNHYKRLARVSAKNNVPQRHCVWSNNEASMLESFVWDTHLVEECGATHRSFQIDVLTQFPMSLYLYWAHQFTGLVTRFQTDAVASWAGDDKRLDRQYLGLALLNDIGHQPNGPHGSVQHPEQGIRLLRKLQEFGFFDDQQIEIVPYWRNSEIIQYGQAAGPDDAFSLTRDDPLSHVYVTAFRRAVGGGRYDVLIVILNASEEPVRSQLYIHQPECLFGSRNQLQVATIVRDYDLSFLPPESDWGAKGLKSATRRIPKDRKVSSYALKDLEDDGFIREVQGRGKGLVYDRIFIPRHDFRVLYGISR